MVRVLAATGWALVVCLGAYGQAAQFEVASVKPSPPPNGKGMSVGCSGGPGTKDPGMVSCENMDLSSLVVMAYNINYSQLTAPDWMRTQMFEIAARVPQGATREQYAEMWQRLLMDRFKLAVHRETKEVAQYDLVAAKNGPSFKQAQEDPPPDGTGAEEPRSHGPNKVDKDGFPELTRPGMIGMNGRIRLFDPKMTMDRLAITLAGQLGRPVTDKTGLKGKYEIRLYWAKEPGPGGAPSAQASGGPPLRAAVAGESLGPSLSQAVQDQLGLRLEARKGPVEFLVVDHIEKQPTEN